MISEASGWSFVADRLAPRQLWSDFRWRRRYQVEVTHGSVSFVQFAPSGDSKEYFRNYVGRIVSAGVTPSANNEEFPSGTRMRGVFLADTFLFGLDFSKGDLSSSMLEGANFGHAWLGGTNFREANLRDSMMFGANLRHASFERADVDGADFQRAEMGESKSELGGALNVSEDQLGQTVFDPRRVERPDVQEPPAASTEG
jgi:hypothetical protein